MFKYFAIVALFPFVALGDDGAQRFCNDPYRALCGQGQAAARASHLETMKKAADIVGLRAVKKAFPQFKRNDLTKEELSNIENKNLRDKVMAVYYGKIAKEVEKHLGNGQAVTEKHFDRIRARMEDFVRKHSSIDKAEADDMLAQLRSVQYVDAVKVLKGEIGDEHLRDKVIEACGKDGFEDNAFQDTMSKKNIVVICPGDFLGGMDRNERNLPSSELLFSNEVWILAHETGHVKDSQFHPKFYEKMRQCLADNHASELDQPIDNYMAEISADWAADWQEALYLKNFATPAARFAALQRSLITLCDTEDDGVHPSGKFRILMLRRNPGIHEVMGCQTPTQRKTLGPDTTCSLEGPGDTVLFKKKPSRNASTVDKGTSVQ